MGWTPDYWKQNKARILEERRRKYNDDPDYREKAIARARAYRQNRKSPKANTPEQDYRLQRGSISLKAYTAAQAAEMSGIEPGQLKYYHRKGYLPPPEQSSARNLYTAHQITLIRSLHDFLVAQGSALKTPFTPEGTAAVNGRDSLIMSIEQVWKS